MATKPATPLAVLAGAALTHAMRSSADAARWRQLAKRAAAEPATHPATKRQEVHAFRLNAASCSQDAQRMEEIAHRLGALVPKAGRPGKVPRGAIEFRIYQGGSHAFNWKALRGGRIIAHATGYDRKRDSVRQVKAIIAAIQAGQFVITQAGQ